MVINNIMDIKDYLRFYLGCEAKSSQGTMTYELSSVDVKGGCMFCDGYGNEMWLGEDFKLILRPLNDMTEEEKKGAAQLWNNAAEFGEVNWKADAASCVFLLSKHFDLFGLIDAGLAIDKKTIPDRV